MPNNFEYEDYALIRPGAIPEEIIRNMIDDGVDEFYEIGPGNVLQGLVKRINPDIKRFGIDKFEDVEKYL